MDPEPIEELLRTRRPQERTFDRPLPDFSRGRQRLTASVRSQGRSPVAGSPWALAFVVAVVVGVGLSGLGLAAVLSPTAPAAGATVAPRSSAVGAALSLTGSMKGNCIFCTATTLPDGRVLIAGGQASSGVPASAELYDPKTGTFSRTGSMTTARVHQTATLLSDGSVLIAGGLSTPDCTPSSCKPLATAELYDPKTGTFSPTGSMTTARTGDTATTLSDGHVMIAGGTDSTGKPLASAELYDPETGTFSPTGSMTTARTADTATVLSDGSVLIAGGADSSAILASAELYDPKTGTFSPTGSMTTARSDHRAVALSDGSVLIAGGLSTTNCTAGSCTVLASAELYDPKTGTFSPTGSMTTARGLQAATALSDGRVLIVGGIDPKTGPLASAELYQP
jgi:hypothetical protein